MLRLAACLILSALPALAEQPVTLEFRGEAILPQDLVVDGEKFGGISGMSYDAENDLYYAVGDDLAHARFHTLKIDLSDGRLDDGDIKIVSSTLFNDVDQQPFAANSLDPEGLALLKDGEMLIAAETVGDKFPAFIRRYDRQGRHLAAIKLDATRYDPRFDEARGSRSSGGFESLTLSEDGQTLYAAFEKPLKQDMAEYDAKSPSPARILEIDLESGETRAEYVYIVGTMTIAPEPADGWYGRGLNDLVWIAPGRFLSVERQYAQGTTSGEGSRPVKIYEVSLEGAQDVSELDALKGGETPVSKTEIFDLETLRIEHGVKRIGSHEVLLRGPDLPDGAQSLILIEDNDFERPTQALLFAMTR